MRVQQLKYPSFLYHRISSWLVHALLMSIRSVVPIILSHFHTLLIATFTLSIPGWIREIHITTQFCDNLARFVYFAPSPKVRTHSFYLARLLDRVSLSHNAQLSLSVRSFIASRPSSCYSISNLYCMIFFSAVFPNSSGSKAVPCTRQSFDFIVGLRLPNYFFHVSM